ASLPESFLTGCVSAADFASAARKLSRCLRHAVSSAWVDKVSHRESGAPVSTEVLPAGLMDNGGIKSSHVTRLADKIPLQVRLGLIFASVPSVLGPSLRDTVPVVLDAGNMPFQ